MRILKGDEHILMPSPVAVHGKRFWSLGILNYFSFDDPDTLLSETRMWKEVPPLFGNAPVVLDTGAFKPRGEFLVAGRCWAPRGETRVASRVRVRVGSLVKTLAIFGDRYWKLVAGMMTGITDPEPFSSMPIVWERAFGGPDFAWNVAGKGLVPVEAPRGTRLPLPNVEYLDRLVTHPSHRPQPACFGLVDPSWKPRRDRIGTCDAQWRDTLWPGLPMDCDLHFFNWASDDQILPGFFAGNETFEIENMNPDFPLLKGRLPAVRQRVVLERAEPRSREVRIQELDVVMDTLWLFPEIRSGIVVHRATTDSLFEDNRDILVLHVVSEGRDTQPRPVRELLKTPDEHYAAKVNMPRTVEFEDMEGLDLFKPGFRERLTLVQTSMARRTVKKSILAQLPRPVMLRTPREDNAALVAAYDRQLAGQARLHENMTALIREQAGNTDADLVVLEEGMAMLKEQRDRLRAREKTLPDVPFDEATLPVRASGPWEDHFLRLVIACRRALEQAPHLLERLAALGLDRERIENAWLGFLPAPRTFSLAKLGLANSDLAQESEATLAPGLVVPRFAQDKLVAVSIFPGWPDKNLARTTAVPVPGSSQKPMRIKSTLPGSPLLWVRNDLEAILADCLCGEMYEIMTLPCAGWAPDRDTRTMLERTPSSHFLHAAGMHEAWERLVRTLCPNVRHVTLPRGRTLTESVEQGGDVRKTLLDMLDQRQILPSGKEPSSELLASAMAYLAPSLVRKYDFREGPGKGPDPASPAAQSLENMNAPGPLADIREKLAALPSQEVRTLTSSEALLLAKRTRSLKGRDLSWLDLSGACLDGVDFSEAILQKTRLANASLRGCTLSSCAVQQADFTNADLSQSTLSQCSFTNCTMNGARLAGAHMRQAGFVGCDLEGADFSGVDARLGSLMRCVLTSAVFDGAGLELCTFTEDRAGRTSWKKTVFNGTTFMGCLLEHADFEGCSITNSAFTDVGASCSSFRHARMEGGHFMSSGTEGNPVCTLAEANFSHADMHACSFHQVFLHRSDFTAARFVQGIMEKNLAMGLKMSLFQGRESRFVDCVMDGSIMRYADFLGAGFGGTRLCGADLRDASLYCADLRGCVLGETLFDRANLGRTVIEGQGNRFRRRPQPDEENAWGREGEQ